MKRCLTASVIAIAAGLAIPAAVRAQVRFRPKVALAGGFSVPIRPTDFSDLWNAGFAVSAGLRFWSSNLVSLGVETGYYHHRFDTEAFESRLAAEFPNVNADGNDLFVVPVTVVAETAILQRGSTRPYASVGAGYYHVSAGDAVVSGPGSDRVEIPTHRGDALGARLGLGVRTALAPGSSLFLDVTYHVAWIDPRAVTFVPLRLGVRF